MRRAAGRGSSRIIALLSLGVAAGIPPLAAAGPPVVIGVDLLSPHRLPEEQVHAAIGAVVGRPLSRLAVRESLERLWALGLFSTLRVDTVPEPGGVRLQYRLTRRPHVGAVAWTGELALDVAELAAASGLAIGEAAEPDRLEEARRALLARYAAEGFLAARVSLAIQEETETNARDVTFVIRAGEPARIGEIRFSGAVRVPVGVLADAFRLREGDRYREGEVREGVGRIEARLRQAGFLEARVAIGKPAPDPAGKRVDLDLQVTEGPEFRVEFFGATAVGDALLRERLTFPESGVVDPVELQASIRQLEAAYQERGYHFVEIRGSIEREGEGRVVQFRVEEGPQVTVEAVTFSGHAAVPAERLQERMETHPPRFLRPGLFRQEVLDRDLRVLLAFLRGEGYPEAAVGPAEVHFSDDRRRARITIPVAEGRRLMVGRVVAEGQTALPAEAILAALPLTPGAPWDAGRADEGRRVVERLYGRRGYHAARVALETARRDSTVDVTYRIQEGEQTRVGRILLRGLLLTQPHIVLRELPLRPGDPFDPEGLAEARRRLAALGLFAQVEVEPLRPPPRPFADIEVSVRERPPWRLDVGVGYSTEEQGRGILEVGHDNLFGMGRSLTLREKVSGRGDRTDATYREPWLFGTRWRGEVGLFREHREEIGFDLERAGGALGIHRELFPERIRGLRGTIGYRLERVERFRVDPQLVAAAVVPGSELVARLVPALTLDRRDDPLDPARGSLHLLSVELGGTIVGGEVNFVKARMETHWFLDWFPPTVLALSARVGLATPFGDTAALPIEDRFFAGGSTTVRGFRRDRLGPRDAAGNPTGGDALGLLNLEWRFPIWGRLDGAVFLDTGAVTATVGDLHPDRFTSGAGAGLRLKTPAGPVRVDWGYLLEPVSGEKRWQLYVTVGHPF